MIILGPVKVAELPPFGIELLMRLTVRSLCIMTFCKISYLSFIIRASFLENRSSGFPTRSHTNQAAQRQKMAEGLKFRI